MTQIKPKKNFCIFLTTLVVCMTFFGAGTAYAVKLEVSPDASIWAGLGTSILLYSHIGGGVVGLLAGAAAAAAAAASLSRKGGTVHRTAGKIFFVAMFITYLIGAGVAPFLTEGQRPNFVSGILALYLLITGVLAAKRRDFRAGMAEKVGLVISLTIVGMGALFMYLGANSESGTVDGSPPQTFFLFIIAGSAAAVGELRVIIKRKLSDTARKLRHLWRMCFSFFIASGALFFGQPRLFSTSFNESILPGLLAFTPLMIMLIWIFWVNLGHWLKAKFDIQIRVY